MSELAAALVKGILGTGTTEDDKLAFVELSLEPGGRHALVFDPEIASNLIAAISSISNQAIGEQNLKDPTHQKSVLPWHIDKVTAGLALGSDGRKYPILQMSTEEDAHLYVAFDRSLLSELISSLSVLDEELEQQEVIQ